jgi:hypothetical protein
MRKPGKQERSFSPLFYWGVAQLQIARLCQSGEGVFFVPARVWVRVQLRM